MDLHFQKIIQHQLADISQSLPHLLPEATLVGMIIILVIGELFRKKSRENGLIGLSILGLGVSLFFIPLEDRFLLFEGSLEADGISSFAKILFVGSGIISLLYVKFFERDKTAGQGRAEYYILFLGLILGLFFLSMAHHLLYLYLSLELVSICSYLLTAYQKRGSKQAEAALKYIIFGATASGIMLYGISWVYGFTGSLLPTSDGFVLSLQEIPAEAQVLAFSLIFAGFLFKVAAFPFHFWAPDVYEGISFPLAGFFSVAPKAAGFIALLRLMHSLLEASIFPTLLMILGSLALVGMSVGNLLAIRQRNIKRLLAYSGISHAGFLLVALICIQGIGQAALLFYLGIYTLLNLSAFILAGKFSSLSGSENFRNWSGMGKSASWAGLLLTVCLAGLIGLPPTGGFIAKWYVFIALFEQNQGALSGFYSILIIGALVNTVISIYYYLSPLIYLFLKPIQEGIQRKRNFLLEALASALIVPILVFGVYGFDKIINHLQNILWN